MIRWASCSALVLVVKVIDRVLVVRRRDSLRMVDALVLVLGRADSKMALELRKWRMKLSGLMVYSLQAWTELVEADHEHRGIPIHVLSAAMLIKRWRAH